MAETLKAEEFCIYAKFIKECQNKTYSKDLVLHLHHIIPYNSCNDYEFINKYENLIKLSVEDHVTAHLLIAEMYENDTYEYKANLRSAQFLNKKSIRDNETLNKIKETFKGENNPFFGKQHTEETKEKLKIAGQKRKGLKYEEIYKDNAIIQKIKRSEGTKNMWANLSDEEKEKRIIKSKNSLKGKMCGSKNPMCFPVKVNDIIYESQKIACEAFNCSSYILYKKYKAIRLPKE